MTGGCTVPVGNVGLRTNQVEGEANHSRLCPISIEFKEGVFDPNLGVKIGTSIYL